MDFFINSAKHKNRKTWTLAGPYKDRKTAAGNFKNQKTGTLQKPENRDPSGTLQKPENQDPGP